MRRHFLFRRPVKSERTDLEIEESHVNPLVQSENQKVSKILNQPKHPQSGGGYFAAVAGSGLALVLCSSESFKLILILSN